MRWALAWLLMSSCAREQVASASPVEVPAVEAPRTLRVEAARDRSWLEAPATALAPAGASAALAMPLAGRVVDVRVRLGQKVERGQPLVDVAMPELIRAAAALDAAALRQKAYAERRAHLTTLVASGLARASEVVEMNAQLALVAADRESARATLRSAGIAGGAVESGVIALRAPIAGTIVVLNARMGEMREPVGSLLEIAGDAPVQIEARFAYRPPSDALFSWNGLPLTLEAISPRVNVADGTWSVWFHETSSAAIAAGSASIVRIEPPEGAVVFPASALREGAVTRRGKRVPVNVFMRGQGEVIATGLDLGDEILP